MAMQQRFQRSLTNIFILSLIALVAACGSSDGKKKDTTPNAFSFTAVTNSALSASVTSNTVTITGIDAAATVSITNGTFSINGGAFVSTGTVTTGQTIVVKTTASTANSTAVTATLTVGGVSGSFSVTTINDSTPNEFTFTDATNVQPGSVNTSTVITVAGIDTAASISIVGGTYSIAGGTYTASAGTVTNGQVVTVKATASASPATAVNAVLTIGGIADTYTVTTVADSLAPAAQILFPPVVSMTEGNTILVRGTASDAYSIKSVKVNGVTATPTNGSLTNWQATVTLADATVPVTATTENLITVVTEDDAGNIATDAAHVSIRQAPLTSSFPDSDNEFRVSALRKIVIDRIDSRNRLLVFGKIESSGAAAIFSVDLATGKRTIFANVDAAGPIVINAVSKRIFIMDGESTPNKLVSYDLADSANINTYVSNNTDYFGASALLLDTVTSIERFAVVYEQTPGSVIVSDAPFTNFTTLSDATKSIPNAENITGFIGDAVMDNTRSRYLMSGNMNQIVYAVDRVSGVRSVFSSNLVGTGASFSDIGAGQLEAMAIDEKNQRVFVVENKTGKVFSVDLTTGNRVLVLQITIGSILTKYINGIALDDLTGNLFVTDVRLGGVLAVDLVSGQQVVVSKSTSD